MAFCNSELCSNSTLLHNTLEEEGGVDVDYQAQVQYVLEGDRLVTAAKINLSCKTKKIVPKRKHRLSKFRIMDRYTAIFCYLILLYFIEINRQSLEITATSN